MNWAPSLDIMICSRHIINIICHLILYFLLTVIDLLLATDPNIIGDISIFRFPIIFDHNAHAFAVLFYPGFVDIHSGGYNFCKVDYQAVENSLFSIPWRYLFPPCEYVDSMYDVFIFQRHRLIKEFVPQRCSNEKHKQFKNIQKKSD